MDKEKTITNTNKTNIVKRLLSQGNISFREAQILADLDENNFSSLFEHEQTGYNIIVTGGAGFIGSNLVYALIEKGHRVTVIDNLYSGRRDFVHPRAEFYEADITDKQEVERVFSEISRGKGIDLVFHLAAQIDLRLSVSDPYLDNRVNVIGGINVLDTAYKYGTGKIVFSSTGGALYDENDGIPSTEDQPARPIAPYGIHKLTFEHYLNYYYQVYGQKYTTLRLANIYGPGQYKGGEAGVITIFIDNAVHGRQSTLYGDGEQTRDFVYVDDTVEAFIKAAESDFVGYLNIGRGVESNILEVIEAIESSIGEKMEMNYDEAREGEVRRSCLDSSKAQKILGWQPRTDLLTGVDRTIRWSQQRK